MILRARVLDFDGAQNRAKANSIVPFAAFRQGKKRSSSKSITTSGGVNQSLGGRCSDIDCIALMHQSAALGTAGDDQCF